jgi:hypothetical protein
VHLPRDQLLRLGRFQLRELHGGRVDDDLVDELDHRDLEQSRHLELYQFDRLHRELERRHGDELRDVRELVLVVQQLGFVGSPRLEVRRQWRLRQRRLREQ